MSTYKELTAWGKGYLEECQIADSSLDAWYLLEHLIRKNRSWYFLHGEEEAAEETAKAYKKLVHLRGTHQPLQQITGEAYFMGLTFLVTPDVLIPRQDTEILVEEALKRAEKGGKVLDLCTGTGCILLSLLYNIERSIGVGADISPKALDVARENSRRLGLEADFIESDLFEGITGCFDMIVSNPPYIPTEVIDGLMEEVRDFEPRLALDGGSDGLIFYRRIVREAKEYLQPGGWLLLEIGHDQGAALRRLMEEEQYEEIEIVRDLAGLDRVVTGKKHQEELHV